MMMSLYLTTRSCHYKKTVRGCHYVMVSMMERYFLRDYIHPSNDKNSIASMFSSSSTTNNSISSNSRKWKHEKWDQMLEQLKLYKEEHGTCVVTRNNPPTTNNIDDSIITMTQLENWVDTQRTQYRLYQEGKKSTLTKDRIQSLEELDFVWNVMDRKWEYQYHKLKIYQQTHGHCHVPSTYTDDIQITTNDMNNNNKHDMDEPSLFRWVASQRKLHKKYQQHQTNSNSHKNPMIESRIAALNDLGFIWDYQEALWYERYNELKQYKNQHGDCIVPRGYEPNPILAKWVDTQRQQRRNLSPATGGKDNNKYKSHLTKERIELLEDIGFIWNVHEYAWNQHYLDLIEFKEYYGHTNVSRNDYPSLHRWILSQLSNHDKWEKGEKSSMTTERRNKLLRIGFNFYPKKTKTPNSR